MSEWGTSVSGFDSNRLSLPPPTRHFYRFPARLSAIPKRPVSTRLNILGTHQLLLTLYFATAVKYTQQSNGGELHPRCQSNCLSLRPPHALLPMACRECGYDEAFQFCIERPWRQEQSREMLGIDSSIHTSPINKFHEYGTLLEWNE